MLKIALWIGAGMLAVGVLLAIVFLWNLFGALVFPANRAESKVRNSPEYVRLLDGPVLQEISNKAGTIVDVKAENGSLILTGDPSRPMMAHQPRLPARIWKVTLPGAAKQ